MPAVKTLAVTARFSSREEGSVFWSTSFMLFNEDPAKRFDAEFDVFTPDELVEKVTAWAEALPLPAEAADAAAVGWSISVRKPARWAPGFKKRFDLSGTGSAWIVKREKAAL